MSRRNPRIYDIESISLGVYTPFTKFGSAAQTLPPEYYRRVAALLAPGQRVLETSAGIGQFTLELARTGADVTPVDISPLELESLRAAFGRQPGLRAPQPVLASAVNLHFLAASFDVVVSGHRFGETGELRSAVIEAHRVLKPGGMLVAVVLTPKDAAFKKGEPEATSVWSFEGTLRHFFSRCQFGVMIRPFFQVRHAWPTQWPASPQDRFASPGDVRRAHIFVLRKVDNLNS